MKLREFQDLLNKKSQGFMVSWELKEGCVLKGDYTPDKHAGEKLLPTEEYAWALARLMHEKVDLTKYFNIYVIDSDFKPVQGYGAKTLNRYNSLR